MMQTPEEWPVWPRLPMKRTRTGAQQEYGVLFDRLMVGQFVWFPGKTIYDKLTPAGDEVVIISKDENQAASLQKILDEGWVVD
jgi:hypothetical protein